MLCIPPNIPCRWTIVLCCCLWPLSVYGAEDSSSYQAALDSIQAEALAENVEDLADIAFEGRESGTRGGRAAGDFLVEEYSKLKVHGAGTDGFAQPFPPKFRNILAMIDGSDPQLRDQVIVIGAHYDHVGYGGRGYSLGPYGYVHPGADDNASGTSAVLALAKAFCMLSEPPKRSILFAAWDAEEKGLLGSKHWVTHPTVPLDRIVAAVNLDMIGRLRDDHLIVIGSRSGSGWRRLLSSHNDDSGLMLDFTWTLKQNADHFPFFDHGIPVLMLHTGLHDQYHRPSDVAKLVNSPGMSRVTRLLFATLYDMANREGGIPSFRATARHENDETRKTLLGSSMKPADRLGVGWSEDAAATGGILVTQVAAGSAAEAAGIKVGDKILEFAGRKIQQDNDFYGAVATAPASAPVVLQRPEQDATMDLTVELTGEPMRWGITWRIDDAEPGVIILTHVVPGTPAAVAGLNSGDRVYQIDGRDFADEGAFADLAKDRPMPMRLLVERDGRLRIVILESAQTSPAKRAA